MPAKITLQIKLAGKPPKRRMRPVARRSANELIRLLSPLLTKAEEAQFVKLRTKLRKSALNLHEMGELERLAELKAAEMEQGLLRLAEQKAMPSHNPPH
jgi:hypothetical protein